MTDLRVVRDCTGCGDATTRGRICRGCRLEHRVFAPIAHAAIYGDMKPLRALRERIERFERGDFGR